MRRLRPVIATVMLALGPVGASGEQSAEDTNRRSRAGRAAGHDIPDVDPRDPRERFAILLPGGPLIVEATMTIDGEPFRMKRDAYVAGFLRAADADNNGEVSWSEMLVAHPCQGIIERQYDDLVRRLDWDRDGNVSRWEAHGLMAYIFDGPAFLVSSNAAYDSKLVNGPVTRPSDLFGLLDIDDDDVLSPAEIAGAGETLLRADTDNNNLLYPVEIGRASLNHQSRRQIYTASQHAVLVEPTGTLLFITIRNKYQSDDGKVVPESFWRTPELFDELDADEDRILTEQEATALNHVEPHLQVTVDFSGDAAESSLTVTRADAARDGPDDTTIVETASVRLNLLARNQPDLEAGYAAVVDQVFVRWDRNGDGYLEEDELAGDFSKWDRDADGKVFFQEFEREFADDQIQSLTPKLTQILVDVSRDRDPLLAALDLSGDSRLGRREMQSASVRLASLDANGDGQLTRDEVPVSYAVDFRIGGRSFAVDHVPVEQNRRSAGEPDWFIRMDRNGDGDLTFEEFLGDRDAFGTLDANGDGFIESAEAKAAVGAAQLD